MTRSTRIVPTDLPHPISAYLAAHTARDVDAALDLCTEDVAVIDEGNTYRGRDAVADWMRRSAGEYTYTSELIGAERIDETHYVAVHHLVGNFPGGVVDLRFAFTLRDGHVAALTIAP